MLARALGGCAAAVVSCAVLAAPVTAGVVPEIPDGPDVPALPAPDAPAPPALPAPPAPGVPSPAVPDPPGVPAPPETPGAPALAPPVAFTGGPLDPGTDRARVTGLVVSGSAPVSYAFEYGPTAAYGRWSVTRSLPAGAIARPVSAMLLGLPPGASTHYRVVATSAAGTAVGEDRVVVTGPGAAILSQVASGVSGDRPGAAFLPIASPPIGVPTELTVLTRSGRVAVSGVSVDLGEGDGGRLTMLACRQGQTTRRAGSFSVPYVFRRAGRHELAFDLLGGTCESGTRRLRRLRSVVTVSPVGRAAQAAGAQGETACPDATLRPTSSNGARVERAIRCLVSLERAGRGLQGLRPSRTLAAVARGHAQDMIRRRYLAHAHPRGPGLARRMRNAGYRGRAGETIALGSGGMATPRAVVAMWMGSTVHRDVILRDRYRAVGVGVEPRAPVRLSHAATYVANFGTVP